MTSKDKSNGWVLIADTENNQLGYVKSKYLSNKITSISSNKSNKPKQTTKTLATYRKKFNKEPDYGEYIDVSSSYFTGEILYSRITEVLDSPSHKRYGKLNEGLAYADRSIEMYGENMVDLGHRSEIKYFLGDYIGALSDINKAIEIAKKDADADYWTARYFEDRELIMLEIEETDSDEDEIIEIEEEEDDEIFNFSVVEDKPIYPGCENISKDERYMCFQQGIMKHIRSNFVYPAIPKKMRVSEKIFVQFVIDKAGNITNSIVVRGEDEHLKNEALRLVNSIPKLKPAKQRGNPVRCSFTVPINFKLQ